MIMTIIPVVPIPWWFMPSFCCLGPFIIIALIVRGVIWLGEQIVKKFFDAVVKS